jgi:hypothetical protein
VFDNRADAERARDDLLASGFSQQEVRMSMADATGQADSLSGQPATGLAASEQEPEGLVASLRHFFLDIFGSDNAPHVQKYSDAVSRGHHVLTVNAADEPEVERAADIVERHGPVDIDEKAAEWAGGAPLAHPESMRMSGAGGLQQSRGPSLQFNGDRGLFQQQSLNEGAPMGGTYQEPMDLNVDVARYEGRTGESLQGSSLEGSARQDALSGSASSGSLQRDTGMGGVTPPVQQPRSGVRVYPRDAGAADPAWKDDESYYRNHWNANYAGVGGLYDDYAPAYGYGAEMARDTKYRDRSWDEVEPDLRSSWDARDTAGGPSTWEKFKAAIRHGWNRMTDDAEYRKHWTSTYSTAGGSYDEYAPAYGYGAEMAQKDSYRDRPWQDVESDLRSDWEARDTAGESTWEKFKAAIRHGWDRMTS